jgi:hypothetical protein
VETTQGRSYLTRNSYMCALRTVIQTRNNVKQHAIHCNTTYFQIIILLHVILFCFALFLVIIVNVVNNKLIPFLFGTRDNVIDSKDHTGILNRRLDRLDLDRIGFPDPEVVHVRDFSRDSVDADGTFMVALVQGRGVLSPEGRNGSNDGNPAILGQRSWDDLEGFPNGHKGSLLGSEAQQGLAVLANGDRQSHLGRTATGQELGVVDDVSDDLHGDL